MSRNCTLFAVLGILLPAFLFAAGGQEADPDQPVEVRLATWAGSEEANELQEILDELNAESETYRITQQSSPAEYYTNLQTQVAGGTAADLMWLDQDNLINFAARGALLDLTDRISEDTREAADLDGYFETPRERFTYEGRVYGLPWISMPVMLYVNLDHMREIGVDPDEINDWTWEDFRDAAIELTRDSNDRTPDDSDFDPDEIERYAFSMVPGWPPLQQWIWQAGGEELTEDLSASPIDSPEAIEGAEFIYELLHEYHVAPSQSVIGDRGFDQMMRDGDVSMFMGGAADDLERNERYEIRAFRLPAGPTGSRANWAWIGGMSIYAQTDIPDVAYEAFIDLTAAIHRWKVPSPRVELATPETIIELQPHKVDSAENIVASLEHMRAPHLFPGYPEWATVFGERYVDPVVRGDDRPADIASEVREMLEEILEDHR
ncbi:MAG: ABC transporter substrate-binding protein [Spirochaetaceae bacterium]